MRKLIAIFLLIIFLIPGTVVASPAKSPLAKDKLTDFTTAVRLTDLCAGGDTYLGEEGCLYPDSNLPLPGYLAQLENVDCFDPVSGKTIIVVIGMSMAQNALTGWLQFTNRPEVNDNLVIIDGTLGSNQQRFQDPDYFGWGTGLSRLTAAGYTASQVKCVIYHNAWSGPSSLGFPAHAINMLNSLETTMNIMPTKYPSVEAIYVTNRHYGLSPSSKHPEPYSFEEGFSWKWLVENRINCTANCGPLIAWFADEWFESWSTHPEYYCTDGLHLCGAGLTASGQIWHDSLSALSYTSWYLDVSTPTPTPSSTFTPMPTNTPPLLQRQQARPFLG